jgi:hypothetical protein
MGNTILGVKTGFDRGAVTWIAGKNTSSVGLLQSEPKRERYRLRA